MKNRLPYFVARVPVPVRTKLLGAFIVILTLLIVFGLLGLMILSGMNQRVEEFVELQRKSVAYRQLQHDTTTQLYSVTSALLAPNERLLDGALRQLNQFRYDLDRVQYVSADEVDLFNRIRSKHEQLTDVVTRVVELTRVGRIYDALELRHVEGNPLADRILRLTNEMVNRAEAQMVAKIDVNQRAYDLSRLVVIGFGIGSIGIALTMVYAISSSLTQPVTLMEQRLLQIAGGDFSQRVNVPNRDELGTLAEYLNKMSDRLRDLYQQIEAASHNKSEFLANMSHELRTPLNAITGYSEMLIENAEEHDKTLVAVSDLEKIQISGRHLVKLINDILDLSKIEAGKMEFVSEQIELETLFKDVVSAVQPLADQNGTRLIFNLQNELGCMHSDPTRIRQILFNLLSNACKFTLGGSVTLHVRRYQNNNNTWLKLVIRDSGIGMTEEQISRLFQPFSQAETETAIRFGGTGLGLAIVHQLCEQMGGLISLKSTLGKGTTVTVDLPYASPKMSSIHSPDKSHRLSNREKSHAEDTCGGRQRA